MNIEEIITTLDKLSKKYCKDLSPVGNMSSLGLLLHDSITADAYECAEKGYEPGDRFDSMLMAFVDVNRLIGFMQGIEHSKEIMTARSSYIASDIAADFEELQLGGISTLTVPNRTQPEEETLAVSFKNICQANSIEDVRDFLESLTVSVDDNGNTIINKKDEQRGYVRSPEGTEMDTPF